MSKGEMADSLHIQSKPICQYTFYVMFTFEAVGKNLSAKKRFSALFLRGFSADFWKTSLRNKIWNFTSIFD